jgi:5-methyltetrahydropteroyltriglutamate--homocysteine methyltransferase
MRRSTDRILTTHVGALPAPHDVWGNTGVADERLRESVAEVIAKQRDAGIDFINEGELTKGGHWVEYLPTRLGGYSPAEGGADTELLMSTSDWVEFQDFYLAALQNGTLFEMTGVAQHVPEGAEDTTPTDDWVATEPIHFTGGALLDREVAVMVESLGGTPPSDAFLTSTAPLSVEPGRQRGIYGTDDEHIEAIAEAHSALIHRAWTSTGLPMRGVMTRSPTFASIQVSCTPGTPAASSPSSSAWMPNRVPR